MNGKKFYGILGPWFVWNHRVGEAGWEFEREDTKTKGIFHFQEREDPGTEKLFRFQGLKKFSRTWNIYHAHRIPKQRNNSYNIWEYRDETSLQVKERIRSRTTFCCCSCSVTES